MKKTTIVMYHYVRSLKDSNYPEIKGLETELFIEQLDYLQRHYSIISVDDLLENKSLPENPILLTFDDGFIDHYEIVYPLLKKRNISGAFFPVIQGSRDMKVLDVHKIHFILASFPNKDEIIETINRFILKNRKEYSLLFPEEYFANITKDTRFDTLDIIYIKRMLQRELPLILRNTLTDQLFRKFVSQDEITFAKTLYMSSDNLIEMQKNGMHIGIHGYSHCWLGTSSKKTQEFEILESINYMKFLGMSDNKITISYPYGSYNDDTLNILAKFNIKLGFTSKVAQATLEKPFELDRYDTNDFPKKSTHEYIVLK